MKKNVTLILVGKFLFAFSLLTQLVFAGNSGNGNAVLVDSVNAEFSASALTITEGDSVSFKDLSTGTPTSWKWTFYGGTQPVATTQKPPYVHYYKAGKFAVKLVVSNATTTDSLTKNMYIIVSPDSGKVAPNFVANKNKVHTGEQVDFQDMSVGNPTSWKWTFQGGSPSNSSLQNASTTYSLAGKYMVKLVVSNGTYTDSIAKTNYIEVVQDSFALNANFMSDKNVAFVGDTVLYTDISTGKVKTREWTFVGAMPNKSPQKNVKVVYNTPGKYPVSLVVTDSISFDTLTVNDYITILEDSIVTTSSCDTFSNVISNDTAVVYVDPNGGYMSGNNASGDFASAEYFSSYTSGAKLNNIFLKFGIAKYTSPNDKVRVCVWDNTGVNGTPGTILAYMDVKISNIATEIAAKKQTFITFMNAPVINTPFYVGVKYKYAAGDTVALFTNTGLNNPIGNAWQLYSDSTWHDFVSEWGVSTDLYITPILCADLVTGIDPVANNSDENIISYPNPCNGTVNIGMSYAKESNVTISVFNSMGQAVYSNNVYNVISTVHTIDLGKHSSGMYIVKIKSDSGVVTKNVMLSK